MLLLRSAGQWLAEHDRVHVCVLERVLGHLNGHSFLKVRCILFLISFINFRGVLLEIDTKGVHPSWIDFEIVSKI